MIEALKSDEIVNKVGGRFKLTALIQKRMLELMDGARPLVERGNLTDLEVVVQEILQDRFPGQSADPVVAIVDRDLVALVAQLFGSRQSCRTGDFAPVTPTGHRGMGLEVGTKHPLDLGQVPVPQVQPSPDQLVHLLDRGRKPRGRSSAGSDDDSGEHTHERPLTKRRCGDSSST